MDITKPTTHGVIIGDSRQMNHLSDGSIHLIVTSPPYWQIKDYGVSAQIGYNDTYGDYVNHLNLVWSQCARVLHPGCRICVNVGDQFARGVHYRGYRVIPIRTDIIRFFRHLGFDYMGSVIWQKLTNCASTGGGAVLGSYPFPRNGVIKIDYEFILIFKKPGKAPKVSPQVKESARMSLEQWKEYFTGHWRFPGSKQKNHLAVFPLELPTRLIRMFSFPGETVLDPFLGSGTTALAAGLTGRNSAGYEINPDFIPVIRDKVSSGLVGIPHSLTFEKGEFLSDEFVVKAISELHYIADEPFGEIPEEAKKKNYGSRVRKGTPPREDYRRVTSVISPVEVELDNGQRFVLSGLKPVAGQEAEAVEFLQDRTRGRRVYLRQDPGIEGGYLYLSNRTFLNAHLVKGGLAAVDRESPGSRTKLLAKYEDRRRKNEKAED